MNRLFLFFPVAMTALLAGCFTPSPIAKNDAESKLRPVIAAIEAFKTEAGRVPNTLDEIQAKRAKKLVLSYSTDSGLVWSISYKKKSSSSYEAAFHHVHYDLYYADGKETDWSFNPWR
jgi:hypothetical protein